MAVTECLFFALTGLSLGFFVSSGAAALLIGLGIIPRYAGITRTAGKICWYENCCILGLLAGNSMYLSDVQLPFGTVGLILYGGFSGIFLGSWIIALGEVVDIFAVTMRRLGIIRGIQLLILAMAAGKTAGTLFYFWQGW